MELVLHVYGLRSMLSVTALIYEVNQPNCSLNWSSTFIATLVRTPNHVQLPSWFIKLIVSIRCRYRVSHHVSDLGWVDIDFGCSTALLGQ